MTRSRGIHRKRSEPFEARLIPQDAGYSSPCLIWQGSIGSHGYGQYAVNRVRWLAHRYAYVAANGEIPHGLTVDHLCRNRRCCAPAHLEVVTRAENTRRQVVAMVEEGRASKIPGRAGSPFCHLGHNKEGKTSCPTCSRVSHHAHRDKLRAKFGTCAVPGGLGRPVSEHIERQRAARNIKAARAAELYAAGVSTPEIARLIGLPSKESVFHHLKVAGVKPNRDGRPSASITHTGIGL